MPGGGGCADCWRGGGGGSGGRPATCSLGGGPGGGGGKGGGGNDIPKLAAADFGGSGGGGGGGRGKDSGITEPSSPNLAVSGKGGGGGGGGGTGKATSSDSVFEDDATSLEDVADKGIRGPTDHNKNKLQVRERVGVFSENKTSKILKHKTRRKKKKPQQTY